MSSRKTQARSDTENSKELTQERFSVLATIALETRYALTRQLWSSFLANCHDIQGWFDNPSGLGQEYARGQLYCVVGPAALIDIESTRRI